MVSVCMRSVDSTRTKPSADFVQFAAWGNETKNNIGMELQPVGNSIAALYTFWKDDALATCPTPFRVVCLRKRNYYVGNSIKCNVR